MDHIFYMVLLLSYGKCKPAEEGLCLSSIALRTHITTHFLGDLSITQLINVIPIGIQMSMCFCYALQWTGTCLGG